MKHFGEHLMIDGYGGSPQKLNDRELVLRCLNDLAARLDMRPLSRAEVHFAEGNDGKDPGGWSGYLIIMESHISIHTFPLRGFVSMDLYTCRNGLEQDRIAEYFRQYFALEELEINFVVRGRNYPDANIFCY